MFRKSSLNGLYTPFGSPVCGGLKPSLPLKKSSFRIPPSPFSQKEGFLKSSRPSLPLKKAPPLTPALSPQEAREETALLGARDRYALRLADHQRSAPGFAGWDRQIYMRLTRIVTSNHNYHTLP